MTDRISNEHRSWNMSRIKNKNTSIEEKVRKYLYKQGYRYRKNVENLPGKPDIFLAKYNTAIFVNGCFWHHHYKCKLAYVPKSKTDFWINKFEVNIQNDIKHQLELQHMGYNVITIWECELIECFEYRMTKLIEEIEGYFTELL
ncbi:MAG: very short patch repair endonuclease [Floccifex sp.]